MEHELVNEGPPASNSECRVFLGHLEMALNSKGRAPGELAGSVAAEAGRTILVPLTCLHPPTSVDFSL